MAMHLGKKPATHATHDDKPAGKTAPAPLDASLSEGPLAVELPPTEIQLLADDLVAVVQTSAYDDMPWPEIDAALMLASHKIKVIIGQHGTLDPSPGDNVPQRAAA